MICGGQLAILPVNFDSETRAGVVAENASAAEMRHGDAPIFSHRKKI
jgi:hypothetical protein